MYHYAIYYHYYIWVKIPWLPVTDYMKDISDSILFFIASLNKFALNKATSNTILIDPSILGNIYKLMKNEHHTHLLVHDRNVFHKDESWMFRFIRDIQIWQKYKTFKNQYYWIWKTPPLVVGRLTIDLDRPEAYSE